ncbi:MAG: hypothetical protein JW981_04575, partial [Anaerolineae bacterium]|nr:hypothetical protein [Anaerolineae bacterium]
LSIPFLSFYWMSLSHLIPDAMMVRSPDWLTPLSITLYLPFAFFASILFGNLYTYILATLASVTVAIIGLVKMRPSKLPRIWLLLVICITIAFPFFLRYQPALVAAPEYKMQLVTNPGFLGGTIKASQNLVERTPCTYELIGWSIDNQLYYRANCNTETQLWQYAPLQSRNHTQVSIIPPDLSVITVSKNTVSEMMRAKGIRPAQYEPQTRRMLVKSTGIVSIDGQWTAVVTQHLYGTQDVVVLSHH